MNCTYFQNQIDRLLEDDLPQNEATELHRHLASCTECAQYYRQGQTALEALTPRVSPKAPSSLKREILRLAAGRSTHKTIPIRHSLRRTFSRIAAAVAVLIGLGAIVMIGIQPANAEIKLLKQSAERLGQAKTIVMTLNVRTRGNENFASIDVEESMIKHSLSVIPAEHKWRLEKKNHIVMSDGTAQYNWLPLLKSGSIDSVDANIVEDFSIFFDPKKILLHELEAAKNPGTEIHMYSTDNEIHLIINAKAKGEYDSGYLFSSSIEESDNRREYVFDRVSELLKSMKVYVRGKGADVLVLETTDIQYDTPIAQEVFTTRPEGYTWSDLREVVDSPLLKGLSAEETAKKVFLALSENNIAPVKAALVSCDIPYLLKEFQGCTVLKWGESVKSARYPGVYISCEVRLKNGEEKQYTIALRNDNHPDGIWEIDGGL